MREAGVYTVCHPRAQKRRACTCPLLYDKKLRGTRDESEGNESMTFKNSILKG